MAQVHRFGDKVAIHLESGETVYITEKDAMALSRVLRECAKDIRDNPKFSESNFHTYTRKLNRY